ncbi:hypothetical protein B296_00057771 [Ensete ventricosum]|uniref:Uncharacterized protein n=1 Tax=Ensete ventricosum TaxID=4639 RepID=A0A426XQ06_ENSVE|nr:hypothetical protein B296_00057771 [Ensete ventricosum]
MKSGGVKGSRLAVPSATDASASIAAVGFVAEKRPSIDEGSSLRKRSRRETSEQPVNTSGSTTRVPIEKGKEPVVTEEALERRYTLHELCEVEDRARKDKSFAIIMTQLKVAKGEAPLM